VPVCKSASSEQKSGESTPTARLAIAGLSMLAIQEQGRSAADSSNPLLDFGVLQTVLSYVGPGHHLFVAPVSKWWRDMYASVGRQQLRGFDEDGCKDFFTCVPEMTLFSSAFASPSRVQLAHANGLDCTLLTETQQCAVGKHASIATLAAAHDLGMEYTAAIMARAAKCKKLAEVQYLHSHGCHWPLKVLEEAASRGYYELVRWCYEHGCQWAVSATNMAPFHAAVSGNVELMAWVLKLPGARLTRNVMYAAVLQGHTTLCQYLHSQQCPWHRETTYAAAMHGHADLLRWLMDNGCPWEAEALCVDGAMGGSVEVLAYLQQQGLLTDPALLTDMLEQAGCREKLAAAKWLKLQGAEWPAKFDWIQWSGKVLDWAEAEGFVMPIGGD
jgi:hypothetical protein